MAFEMMSKPKARQMYEIQRRENRPRRFAVIRLSDGKEVHDEDDWDDAHAWIEERTDKRPCRESLHMMTAEAWSYRSTCKRNRVGAVITTEDMRQILSIGYNGPARGLSHDRCRDEAGACGCLHAEANAIASVNSTIPNKVIFVTASPCEACAQLIIQANIWMVFYNHPYRSEDGLKLLRESGIRSNLLGDILV